MRKKAAEELKKEQERKAAERRRIIEERCGKPKDLESANEGIYARLPFHKHLLPLNYFLPTIFIIFSIIKSIYLPTPLFKSILLI